MASTSTIEPTKSAAELMQEKHEAAPDHHPTIEDVVDEDDVEHPPPPHATQSTDQPVNGTNQQPMSSKAVGKQRASGTPTALDTNDDDAFPALGGGPKPRQATPASTWAPKLASNNLTNGSAAGTARPPSSGASTPASNRGYNTASYAQSARPQEFGHAPQVQSLPGRFRYEFEILNSEVDREKLSPQLLKAMSKKNNVAISTQSTNYGRSIKFIIEGPRAAVEKVIRIVAETFTLKKKQRVEVPSAIKSHIIGKGGSNIEAMEKKYGVKIQVLDKKDGPASDTSVVEIGGNAAQVRTAEQAILDLVKERQPKVNLPLENVMPRLYPFIAAQHAPKLQQWQEDHGVQVEIPSFAARAAPVRNAARAPKRSDSITVSGDLAAARRAHTELDLIAKALMEQLKIQEEPFPPSLHPFIVGERGMTQEQFFAETGCVIILPEDGSEEIQIFGPEDRLEDGLNKAMELVGNVKRETVDLHKPFTNAPRGSEAHARALERYLNKRQVMEDIRGRHNADLVFPGLTDRSDSWSIFADDQRSVLQGRSDLMKIIGAHPPERLSIVDMDPFFHRHLPGLAESELNDMGVHMVIPDTGEDHVILVYEGVPQPDIPFEIARQRPSAEQVSEFETSLRQANNLLLSLIGDSIIAERSMQVPQKHHNEIRRFTDGLPAPTGPSAFNVQVHFPTDTAFPPSFEAPQDASLEDFVFLRGQGDDVVEELEKQILAELLEIQENEKLRNHRTVFDFPDKQKDRLVGRQGSHVNELRTKYNVEIDTKPTGQVQIRGPPKFAEPCKAEILRLQKQWADEVTIRIKVDPKHVGSIIGKSGSNLKRLRERTQDQVVILAPPSMKYDDSQSTADTASDVGSTRAPRAKDEFVVRGPRQLAETVKTEIEELHAFYKENSHEATVMVAKDQVPMLIGKGGSEIEKLRAETGATIDFPKNSTADRVPIQVKGTKTQVEKAKAELQKRAQAYDDIAVRKIEVDQKLHQHLIGPGGSNLQRIIQEAGAQSTEAVQFPKKGVESNTVTITASKAIADKLVAIIERSAGERANDTNETVDVPADQHRILIGHGGEARRSLETEYKVRINIPNRNSGSTGIKISGPKENIARCKDEIISRTTKQPGETILVPIHLHHQITDRNRIFHDLRNKKVTIDHDGHKPPTRPESGLSTPVHPAANGDMPLITDDSDALRHSWKLVKPPVADEANGSAATIPWILSGPPEAVAAAKKLLEKRLANAKEPRATGYLKLSDPSLHKYVIGKGGSKINEIRTATGCDIQIPNPRAGASGTANGGGGEGAITIIGEAEQCEEAKVLILEAAENGPGAGY